MATKYNNKHKGKCNHSTGATAFPFPSSSISSKSITRTEYSFSFVTKSTSSLDRAYPECEDSSNPSSPSPSPSQSPTVLMSYHALKSPQVKRCQKRKLDGTEPSKNCLKKIALSDGTVCYTVQYSSAYSAEPPIKRPRSNSDSTATTSSSFGTHSFSQPPTNKRRPNSCNTLIYQPPNKHHCHQQQQKQHKRQQQMESKEPQMKTNSVRPKLVHSQTMPIPAPPEKKDNSKRRHSGDWMSKEKLLQSLQQQTQIQEQLFPSQQVHNVDLKEIFNGLKMIRVHKKLRPINMRRETQLFK